MVSLTKQLAKSASQRLKGLIIEYDVVCSSLGGPADVTFEEEEETVTTTNNKEQSDQPTSIVANLEYAFGTLPAFGKKHCWMYFEYNHLTLSLSQ